MRIESAVKVLVVVFLSIASMVNVFVKVFLSRASAVKVFVWVFFRMASQVKVFVLVGLALGTRGGSSGAGLRTRTRDPHPIVFGLQRPLYWTSGVHPPWNSTLNEWHRICVSLIDTHCVRY